MVIKFWSYSINRNFWTFIQRQKGGDEVAIIKENTTNQRQMPSTSYITREKNYCDLLYAWCQCNSERVSSGSRDRRIHKSKIKWTTIEKDFTRKLSDGTEEKVMNRKTIAKYFNHLEESGLITLDPYDDYYYLRLLGGDEANLIEYETLRKLMNVLQKNSLSIYIYLFNKYWASGQTPFIATMKQIKDFIGIATTTTSNNLIVDDTIDILKRLKLLDYVIEWQDGKSMFKFIWVRNALPD